MKCRGSYRPPNFDAWRHALGRHGLALLPALSAHPAAPVLARDHLVGPVLTDVRPQPEATACCVCGHATSGKKKARTMAGNAGNCVMRVHRDGGWKPRQQSGGDPRLYGRLIGSACSRCHACFGYSIPMGRYSGLCRGAWPHCVADHVLLSGAPPIRPPPQPAAGRFACPPTQRYR